MFSRLDGLPLSEYLRHKVLSAGLLYFLCSSKRPSLFSVAIEVYQQIRSATDEKEVEKGSLLASHLAALFIDVSGDASCS